MRRRRRRTCQDHHSTSLRRASDFLVSLSGRCSCNRFGDPEPGLSTVDCSCSLRVPTISRPDHQVYKSPRSLRFAPVCLLRYVVCCDCCEISLGYRLSGAPGEKRRGCSEEDCVGCSCTGHQGTSLGPFKGVSRSGRLAWGFQSAILRQGMIPSRVGANILPMVLTCS